MEAWKALNSISLCAVFHSICPLSLNLLISTSLPYFVREVISEIYMKRQFPSSFLSLHSLSHFIEIRQI